MDQFRSAAAGRSDTRDSFRRPTVLRFQLSFSLLPDDCVSTAVNAGPDVPTADGPASIILAHDQPKSYEQYAAIPRIWAEIAPYDDYLLECARVSAHPSQQAFRQALGQTDSLDSDAAFLLVYALTDRFPYHAFAVDDTGECVLAADRVTATILAVLDGLDRVRRALQADPALLAN